MAWSEPAIASKTAAGVGLLLIVVFYSISMAILAVISGLSIWPTANATAISTEINNSIVTMAQFFPIIGILGAVGLILVLVPGGRGK